MPSLLSTAQGCTAPESAQPRTCVLHLALGPVPWPCLQLRGTRLLSSWMPQRGPSPRTRQGSLQPAPDSCLETARIRTPSWAATSPSGLRQTHSSPYACHSHLSNFSVNALCSPCAGRKPGGLTQPWRRGSASTYSGADRCPHRGRPGPPHLTLHLWEGRLGAGSGTASLNKQHGSLPSLGRLPRAQCPASSTNGADSTLVRAGHLPGQHHGQPGWGGVTGSLAAWEGGEQEGGPEAGKQRPGWMTRTSCLGSHSRHAPSLPDFR